jgi:metallo-beta-lactamase family protein
MKLQFLGATTTVTGSQYLLTTDRARVLVDCGMFQGAPHETAHNRAGFAFDPRELDAMLLTHAHLDHCGMTPVLAREGFRGPIHATRPTVELARLVLLDSGRLQEEQAEARRERAERIARRMARGRAAGRDVEAVLREQRPRLSTEIGTPLYTEADAERCLPLFRALDYDQPIDAAPGIRAVFRDAGHILGSAIIEVEARESDAAGRERVVRIVFSGDVGRPNAPIIGDPTGIDAAVDYVLVESTYGGRTHEPPADSMEQLADAVRWVAAQKGVLLVPAFAIGRTQEVVWTLNRLVEQGRIPRLPLFLDSPMASGASAIYRRFPGYYDDETHRLLAEGDTPLDYPEQAVTRTADESRAIERSPRPYIVVASNGTLTGGRVVHHFSNLVGDPRALVLFVGYQGQGTVGAHLQSGARRVRVNGAWREVRCQARSIGGFSAHADEPELVDWLRHFARAPRRPKRVFVVHGDPEGVEAVVARVRELGLEPYQPAWRETVDLA